jgi:ferredoxin
MAKITIKNNEGKKVADFTATADESIANQAMDAGADIPVSCGVGACRTCVGKVTKGAEFIDKEKIGPSHVPIEDDEVLTCIAGCKDDAPEGAEIEIECENL